MINKTTGYMAAVVKVGGKNRYYVHRILMPDGSEFMFKEKTEPIGAGVPAQKSSKGSAISPAYNDNIADNSKKNKKQFSLPDTDSESNNLTDAQREYFKDSKIVNGEGKLMPVYHGTANDFTEFDYFMRENNTHGIISDLFFSFPMNMIMRSIGAMRRRKP